jgi:hypothetical protein
VSVALAALLWAGSAQAASLRACDTPVDASAAQKDRLLRFAALIRETLQASGAELAVVSRSGLDLARFGVRTTHAGLALRQGLDTPWAVRQLYYACDEGRPRVFDQGLAGFVLGLDSPDVGLVSAVLLPADATEAVRRTALDRRRALALLGGTYSANAYPFAERYQNCNQWVAELLAEAWQGEAGHDAPAVDRVSQPGSTPVMPRVLQSRTDAGADDGARTAPSPDRAAAEARGRAQAWLRRHGYQPAVFQVAFPPIAWLSAAVPWLHHDDHPPEDVAAQRLAVSLPASIESLVRLRVPGAQRVEFCHTRGRVVVRHGWEPIASGCVSEPGDTVLTLD